MLKRVESIIEEKDVNECLRFLLWEILKYLSLSLEFFVYHSVPDMKIRFYSIVLPTR